MSGPARGAAPTRQRGGRGERLRQALFPDPPRRIPGQRAIGIALRTAHLVAFGLLVGGHAFEVEPARLVPFLAATIATGAALMALELASTCAWLCMGKGIAVLLKLGLLLLVPVLWEQRVLLLVAVIVLASVGAHMPSRFRYWSLLTGRRVELPARRLEEKR